MRANPPPLASVVVLLSSPSPIPLSYLVPSRSHPALILLSSCPHPGFIPLWPHPALTHPALTHPALMLLDRSTTERKKKTDKYDLPAGEDQFLTCIDTLSWLSIRPGEFYTCKVPKSKKDP